MNDWQPAYWKFFNGLGRVVGIIFFGGGVILSISGLISLRNPQIPKSDAWIGIFLSLIFVILGIFLVIAKPFKPGEKDDCSHNLPEE